MKVSFAAVTLPKSGALAVPVQEGRKLLPTAAQLDKKTGGALSRAMSGSRFEGKSGELLEILVPAGIDNDRVLLYGLGDPKKLVDRDLQDAGGNLAAKLNAVGEKAAAVVVEAPGRGKGAWAANLGYGALLASYRFDKYKTKEPASKKLSLAKLSVLTAEAADARKLYRDLEEIAAGVFLTRDLVSEPANVLYPAELAARAKALSKLGIKVQVLGEAQMEKLGMGALLGVGQGSARESQLLVMRWDGAPKAKDKRPIAFVGKGVCFDTGGISIKPASGMEDMKWDMGGAGVVVGLMRALAGRKAQVNAVGICGLVENMPSGKAQRPGDIVTTASGQTVEVLNTDAEGRLVLADALWYVQDKFKPRAIVDLATLTGAIIVSLGSVHAGLFSNDDALSEQLTTAGKEVGELVWRMPLGKDYDKAIDTEAADMKNIGNREAGSITAAQFLQRFVEKDLAWAHLDIAGVTWSKKGKPTAPKGGTGFGVRLLDRLVAAHYES